MLVQKNSPVLLLLLSILVGAGCSTSDSSDSETDPDTNLASKFSCLPEQPSPYDSTTPYLGIHGDAGNSDVVACDSASNFEEAWHVLRDMRLPSPILLVPMVL